MNSSSLLSTFLRRGNLTKTSVRSMAGRMRFYKEASVAKANESFEVDLDRRKLKSPHGNILKFQNEALAHAVALEWNSQPMELKLHMLPLTTLCFSAADNVEGRDPQQIVDTVMQYLKTDTVLYFMDDVPELFKEQQEKWGSVIEWVNKRFDIKVEHTTGFKFPNISDNAVPTLTNHLLSFDHHSLLAFEMMSGILKSVILTMAVVDRHLTCVEAVELALLEQRFQIKQWGNVEWHHDIELHDAIMKTAAASTYIQLTNEVSSTSPLQESAGKN